MSNTHFADLHTLQTLRRSLLLLGAFNQDFIVHSQDHGGSFLVCGVWNKIRSPGQKWQQGAQLSPLTASTSPSYGVMCSVGSRGCKWSFSSTTQHLRLRFRQSLHCRPGRPESQKGGCLLPFSPNAWFTLLRSLLLVHDCNPLSETLFIVPYFTAASQISFQLCIQANRHIEIIWPITFLRILSGTYHFRTFTHQLFSKPKSSKHRSSVGTGETQPLSFLQDTVWGGGSLHKIKSIDFRTRKDLVSRLTVLVTVWTNDIWVLVSRS